MRKNREPENGGAKPARTPASFRNKAAIALLAITLLAIPAILAIGGERILLDPGPLASPHSAIKDCQSCHTQSGEGRLSWLPAMFTRDPHADSQACLTCHTIPQEVAFNPHSATAVSLNDSTSRLKKVAQSIPHPQSAALRDIAFPMDSIMSGEIYCATCHNDHQGIDFQMDQISDAQCHSCHAVQFDDFAGQHPDFSDYPFKRRQRIKYDHEAHFNKHYPEIASKNDPSKPIPGTCSECHNSETDRRHMAVAPFDQNCAACHLDQITGEERAIGPKGIAFLSLPGLDIETLNERGAAIGEWPAFSEAELSPFMALIIGQKAQGQAMLKAVEGLDLLDLTDATDEQIASVTRLVWAVKGLFYALLSGKASDVLADLNTATGTQVSAALIADLSANLPRDVIINAQLEWLPNLAEEMLQRRAQLDQEGGSWGSAITETKLSAPVPSGAGDAGRFAPGFSIEPPASGVAEAPAEESRPPLRVAQAASDDSDNWTIDVFGRLIKGSQGPADGEDAVADEAESGGPGDISGEAIAESGATADIDTVADADSGGTAPAAAPNFAPIESSVDSESWAEYGGWYRRDFAILYRPAGHKDKFIYSWLNLTGPHARTGSTAPASAIFEQLTLDDAQGQCVKCHSVDDRGGFGLLVNWSPSSLRDKQTRFTKFVHEPHFAVMENDGCLTCHELKKGAKFSEAYEQGSPDVFNANFSSVKKDLCQSCHGQGARQDCQLCHEYHVEAVPTPIIRTQIPN